MNLSDQSIVDAIMQARAQIDFLWQFFVSVHIALFALLFIYDHAIEAMNYVARAFMVAGVGLFNWINGNGIVDSYNLLNALHHQFRFQFGQADKYDPQFYKFFVLSHFEDRPLTVLITHSLAFAVVMLSMFWRRFISEPVSSFKRRDA